MAVDDIGGLAFWLHPDWSGGDNLRDPNTRPFWELPPKKETVRIPRDGQIPLIYGRTRLEANYVLYEATPAAHVCGPFVTTPFGYCYCKEGEKEADFRTLGQAV